MIRLDKYLADTGLGTRSDIRSYIRRGLVTVDGQVVTDPGLRMEAARQTVCLEGKQIGYQSFLYYMLHKPAGVVSATRDPRQKTALDLLPGVVRSRGMFPVGRLDKDTTGLLLLTNDGGLAHRLLAPRGGVDKRYEAVVDRLPSPAEVARFESGTLALDGKPVLPARLCIVSPEPPIRIETTVREGRYHQVKRMLSACGCQTLALKRLSMGALVLDPDLPEGRCRPLTEKEINSLPIS